MILWNEFLHEVENKDIQSIYTKDIYNCIKDFIPLYQSLSIETTALKEINNVIPEEKLKNCKFY